MTTICKPSTTSHKLAAAAFAGLIGVSMMTAGCAYADDSMEHMAMEKSAQPAKEKHACKGMNSCKGLGADGKNECKGHGSCRTDIDESAAPAKEKHACKGLNSCKGQGADGKNECKGKGSCKTDTSGDVNE